MSDEKKLYFSTQEAAEKVGVKAHTLRFWEKEIGSLLAPRRTPSGVRTYTREDIETLKIFHYLTKEQGLSLSAAHLKLRNSKSEALKKHKLYERLNRLKDKVYELRSLLALSDDENDDDDLNLTN